MRKKIGIAMPAAVLALAGQLWAGGFYLQLGNPEANPEARKLSAALLVKAVGCHDPALASRIPRIHEIIAFRNLLIHGYAFVEHARVLRTAHDALPALRSTIAALIKDLGGWKE